MEDIQLLGLQLRTKIEKASRNAKAMEGHQEMTGQREQLLAGIAQ